MMVGAAIAAANGCAHHRVVVPTGDPDQTPVTAVTHHQYFWGLVGEPTIQATCSASHSLYDVEVSTNFWQGLATVVTLGIWLPATVEWRCATVQGTSSDAPIPLLPHDEDVPHASR